MNLDKLKVAIAKEAGLNMENKAKGLCVDCGKPALENCYSDAGRAEVAITGLCEFCYDKACEEE